MREKKNILITTLSNTKDHLEMAYYYCKDENDEIKFCTGISGAEAGTKYILSKYKIDEIIVLGTPENMVENDASGVSPTDNYGLIQKGKVENITEFSFFGYRIAQYLEHIDIEANDILYYSTGEKRNELRAEIKKRLPYSREGYFYKTATDKATYEKFCKLTESFSEEKEQRWLKHTMYLDMESVHKMHALKCNADVKLYFVPLERDENGSFSVEGMVRVVKKLASNHGAVGLYMDLQGMNKVDSYTLWSMLAMVHTSNTKFRIKSIIHTSELSNSFVHVISDAVLRYEIETLLAGMQSFIKYGKVELLEEYCQAHTIHEPAIENLLRAMRYIDTGVSLCNPAEMKHGIKALRAVFAEYDTQQARGQEAAMFSVLEKGIREDYGPLLDGDEVSVYELIAWALRKHFYQQALTLVESLIPSDMVQRGILYYARTKEDIEIAMKSWNALYWSEVPKCRYVFGDLDHFFVKSYVRSVINNRQSRERVACDMASALVAQAYGTPNPNLCNIYSELNDENLLYDILHAYYSLGILRNQVSHANAIENAVIGKRGLKKNENFELLKSSLEQFLALYQTACKRLEGVEVSSLHADAARFQAYTMQHHIVPLMGGDSERVVENSYQCSFNGQEVHIVIQMTRTDEETEDFG